MASRIRGLLRSSLPAVSALAAAACACSPAHASGSQTNCAADLPAASHRRDSAAVARFFESEPAPKDLDGLQGNVKLFLIRNLAAGRRVAIVTSGGTMVPLEQRTVRFVDNFSTGSRGAALAECLLRQNYAVIFLHRAGSRRPFLQRVSDGLDATIAAGVKHEEGHGLPGLELPADPLKFVRDSASWAARVRVPAGATKSAQLLEVPFTSVSDYLHKLRGVAHTADEMATGPGTPPLLLLAAAVSDFYVPNSELPEHKIQSDDSVAQGLTLRLTPVPKTLWQLANEWAPRSCIVSFKLCGKSSS